MKKKIQVLEYELPVKIEPQKEGGFVASCSLWKDCYAQGDTIEEVISEINSVASSLIELHKEEGIKIPLKIKKENSLSQGNSFQIPVIVSA